MKKIGISCAILSVAAFGFIGFGAHAQPVTTEDASKEFASRTLAKIDALETQMRDLTNIVERLEKELAAQKTENQRLAKIIDENSAKLSLLEDKTEKKEPAPPPVVKEEEKKIEPIVNPPTPEPVKIDPAPAPPIDEKVEKKDEKPLNPPIVTPIPPSPIVEKALSAEELLGAVKLSIQNSEYPSAKENLKVLMENHKETKEGIEAHWLDGELNFLSKDWLGAAKDYVAYLKIAPNGPRVSDVLIRLASSYREMGDNRQRCLALNAYKERTPKPNAIQKARADDEFAKGTCPKTK